MKRIESYLGLVVGVIIVVAAGCKKDDMSSNTNSGEKPYVPTPYNIDVPVGFPAIKVPSDNPITVEGVALGRMLYYDNILDKDSARNCASCHIQSQAFQIDNGSHQVLPHINLAWSTNYMWNGGFQGTLEDVMLFEVEQFFETDLGRLNSSQKYRGLFNKAFGVDVITSKEVAYALAQFERTMISSNSKYDKFMRGQASLTNLELEGSVLYFTEEADCFHCHGTSLLTDNTPRNNGLDLKPDSGLMAVTGNIDDLGKFKVPTLRNIANTAPYMHDGRFKTLEEVVDFYSEGVNNTSTVDPLMVYAHQGGVHLTSDQKKALVAFLKTFSDEEYMTNPELSDPF